MSRYLSICRTSCHDDNGLSRQRLDDKKTARKNRRKPLSRYTGESRFFHRGIYGAALDWCEVEDGLSPRPGNDLSDRGAGAENGWEIKEMARSGYCDRPAHINHLIPLSGVRTP